MDAIDRNDNHTVTSPDELAKIYAKPLPHIAIKETDHITDVGRAFIAASPFLVLGTSNGTSIDCSPKGDAPGFVQLLDDRTLLIPDRARQQPHRRYEEPARQPEGRYHFHDPGIERNLSGDWKCDDQHGPGVAEAIRGARQAAARGHGRRRRGSLQSLSQSPRAGEAVGGDGAAEGRAQPRRLRRRPRWQGCCLRPGL
jgi:hypothetical protein